MECIIQVRQSPEGAAESIRVIEELDRNAEMYRWEQFIHLKTKLSMDVLNGLKGVDVIMPLCADSLHPIGQYKP